MPDSSPQPDQRPVVSVEGERVALGPLRRELLPLYARWNNDFVTTRALAWSRPTTLEQEAARFEALGDDGRYATFTVYERATSPVSGPTPPLSGQAWRPIGIAYLAEIDHVNRTAEFGIAIGERDGRGKGLGTEVTRLVLDVAFTALGLHNVILTVREDNVAGRRAYEKAGFKEMGRRRQAKWSGGRYWDDVYMDCLANDYARPMPERTLDPDEPTS